MGHCQSRKASIYIGMYSGRDYYKKSSLCTFWSCHPTLSSYCFLTLAAKRRRKVTAIPFGDFCLSICPNPPMLNGKGSLRESMHLRYTRQKGIVVMLNPAQWCR